MDVQDKPYDVDKELEKLWQKKKENRVGAWVFCVSCGNYDRVPLRKWHNCYLCTDCFKIAKKIGDEAFIKALEGGFPSG